MADGISIPAAAINAAVSARTLRDRAAKERGRQDPHVAFFGCKEDKCVLGAFVTSEVQKHNDVLYWVIPQVAVLKEPWQTEPHNVQWSTTCTKFVTATEMK